jgi:hypothetical protein
MSKYFRKRSDSHEKILEPRSLSPNAMVKEGEFAAVIAIPLLAFLGAILYVASNFRITEEDFMLMSFVGLALWIAFIVVIYAVNVQKAAQYYLFDRVFGFTPRLHPQLEIYCMPEDIRVLNDKGNAIQNLEALKDRLKALKFDAKTTETICKTFDDNKTFPLYLFYFRHRGEFEGWDAEKHEIPVFKSHIVFGKEPFDRQFIFGPGQENWFNMILFNHPRAETDVVKIVAWALDPFLGTPMPVCVLVHSSLNFKGETVPLQNEEVNLVKILQQFSATQHGIIESQWKKIKDLDEIKQGKFTSYDEVLKLADQKADKDIEYYERIMQPPRGKLWQRTWFKIITFALLITFALIIAAMVMGWMPKPW